MHLPIHISETDGTPIYSQIAAQVMCLVAAGRLEPDAELPPIRVLADQLLVNPNTVARAYRELEVAGVVVKKRTSGTYVAAGGTPAARAELVSALGVRVESLIAEAAQIGVSEEELIEMIRSRRQGMQQTLEGKI